MLRFLVALVVIGLNIWAACVLRDQKEEEN